MALNLIDLGLRPLNRVIVQLANTRMFASFYFALQRIGAIPIMALPSHRYREISQFAALAGAVAAAAPASAHGTDFADLHRRVAAERPGLRFSILQDRDPAGHSGSGRRVISLGSLHDRRPTRHGPADLDRCAAGLNSCDPAVFQLSGGTTGIPKLIPRTHNDYAFNSKLAVSVCDVRDGDVLLDVLPIEHNLPLACPACRGSCCPARPWSWRARRAPPGFSPSSSGINRGGERFSAEEVENLILGHPAVVNAACVPVPDPVLGERMCACVILRPGHRLALEELTGFLAGQEIDRHKLPEQLAVLDRFPLSPVGKVSKKALAAQVRAGGHGREHAAMRRIDLHAYPGTAEWIASQGPYVEPLSRYWKKPWAAKSDEVVADFRAHRIEAVLVAFDIESVTGAPPCTNDYVAGLRDRYPVRLGSLHPSAGDCRGHRPGRRPGRDARRPALRAARRAAEARPHGRARQHPRRDLPAAPGAARGHRG